MSLLRGLVAASHPFPVVMVVSLTALIGLVSTRDDPDVAGLALTALGMLFAQLAIGWHNDFVDRETDIRYQPDKPVSLGLVDERALRLGVFIALFGFVSVGAALGWVALALLVMGTAAGLVYNQWLKDTRLSWLPYVAAFALLPTYVWVALDAFAAPYLVLYTVGAPLVLAVHIANSLPDIEADRQAGRRGSAAQLGRQRSLLLAGLCLALSVTVVAVSAVWLTYEGIALATALGAYAALVAAAMGAYQLRADADLSFRLVALAAVVLAVGWLFAVEA
jgi:4-hydroxybenzoate polyprenyltransferase